MMAKVQKFGSAMFAPVLFFIYSGMIVAIASVANNPSIVGSIANEGTLWNKIWQIIDAGGWTVFNNMEILFVIGLPLGLAAKAKSRAMMEAFVLYMTFNTFVSKILELFGSTFNVDFSAEVGNGLKMIGGIKTLDTGVVGAIIVAGIAIYLHNRFFDKKLPEWLGIFQGSVMVAIVGFVVTAILAVAFSFVWPILQQGIVSLQAFMVRSGNFGVFTYVFLEKALLPFGLHHFIYAPFMFGPAVVEGGTALYWMEHLNEFAMSHQSLKSLYPEGGFSLTGLSNIFGVPGIATAFYFTAKPENRKKLLALLIPGVLTAVLCGITEPFDYTFLFIAPALFYVHAGLAAALATTMFVFGVVGEFSGGLIEMVAKNFLPMWANHWQTYVIFLVIGLIFTALYIFIFRGLILKFSLPTPGREEGETELRAKNEYKEKKALVKNGASEAEDQAAGYLLAFGGSENIDSVGNCATRLRISVKDPSIVKTDEAFRTYGAKGVVRQGNAFQVIIGLSVPQVREEFDRIMRE